MPYVKCLIGAKSFNKFSRRRFSISRLPLNISFLPALQLTPSGTTIIGQYRPTYLSRCQNAIDLSNAFVKTQLATVMFNGQSDAKKKAQKIVKALTHYTKNKTHDRHAHYDECHAMGLQVKSIENDDEYKDEKEQKGDFQDLVLTVHHCYMHFLMNTPAYKIIENHLGVGMSKNITSVLNPNVK